MDKLPVAKKDSFVRRPGEQVILVKKSQLPAGAILLTEKEVVQLHYKRISKWQPQSDIWPFLYGPFINAGATLLSCALVNTYFRNKFMLQSFGRIASYVPALVMPTMLSHLFQKQFEEKTFLNPPCPSCLEIQAGIVQVAASVGYCCLISPVISIYLSRKFHTYQIKNNFQPNVLHAVKSTPLARNCLMLLMALNFGMAYFLTYEKGRTVDLIVTKEAVAHAKRVLNNEPIDTDD